MKHNRFMMVVVRNGCYIVKTETFRSGSYIQNYLIKLIFTYNFYSVYIYLYKDYLYDITAVIISNPIVYTVEFF